MVCNNCKKIIDNDSKFCSFCGYKIYCQKPQRVWLNSVADYLELIGMKITVSLKSSDRIITGVVKDLSDDGKSLVLIDLNDSFKNKRGKCNISLSEIDIIEVVDRFLK
jgi:hypothetical protein